MSIKNRLTKRNFKRGIVFAEGLGDFVESRLGKAVEEGRFKAHDLPEEPEKLTWYRVPLEKGLSGDGSEYYIYVKLGDPDKLCIFFSGGGVAWNEYTAARPVTGGKVAAGLPNYYWNNLRPFTQIMNINVGITDVFTDKNPFKEWSFVVITYATGDFHIGNNDYPYKTEDGRDEVLHFHGYVNFLQSMQVAKKLFPKPDTLLIAGNSAGAFAVPALAGEVVEDYYPKARNITLFSDSGQLLYKNWRKTAKNIWMSKESLWKPIHGDNITLEWYKDLYSRFGDRFRYLYSSSSHDYLLSAYYNDIVHKKYKTDADVQEEYYQQLKVMVAELKAITPAFGMFINDWRIPLITMGGTVHTSVREPHFLLFNQDGITQAAWLHDAVEGKVYDVGMDLLKKDKTKGNTK
ncbi:pectin acetylesterase-family hydrolase [Butyrivibrio sp. DSM 10294]|uniref:pectin acetylesterase-family hydrolase n=1 Tax=Butyrivibrio sp. DSM 10294 TaxID=2972457 RepID=UPI00234F4265|nr:pectin acetylesterase-family hydrolase [Butyrivibrio sp. DSM 10294]MDC7294029.1 pectin acetylesterase-family hydrolase [Butyrivibrio sp. DSM 10294]